MVTRLPDAACHERRSITDSFRFSQRWAIHSIVCISVVAYFWVLPATANDSQDKMDVALDIASVLRTARTVIATNQSLINDEYQSDKGLTGQVVVDAIVKNLKESGSVDTSVIGNNTQAGRLMQIQLDAFKEIMDENQALINQAGIGFKGFVPAVFAQLSNERFGEKAGTEARVKVTAPIHLVRNRKARPDSWESNVIVKKFAAPDWPKGELFAETTRMNGKLAYRVIVPEYYSQSCLACHGHPTTETDITGHPKEGGRLGDLGGAISITLFE